MTDTPVYAKKWQVSARLTMAGSTAHIAAAETCPDTVSFYYGKARASSHSGHNVLILFSIWEKMKNVNTRTGSCHIFAEKNAGIPGL